MKNIFVIGIIIIGIIGIKYLVKAYEWACELIKKTIDKHPIILSPKIKRILENIGIGIMSALMFVNVIIIFGGMFFGLYKFYMMIYNFI